MSCENFWNRITFELNNWFDSRFAKVGASSRNTDNSLNLIIYFYELLLIINLTVEMLYCVINVFEL